MNHFAVHLKLAQHGKSTILQLKKKSEGRKGLSLEYPTLSAMASNPSRTGAKEGEEERNHLIGTDVI